MQCNVCCWTLYYWHLCTDPFGFSFFICQTLIWCIAEKERNQQILVEGAAVSLDDEREQILAEDVESVGNNVERAQITVDGPEVVRLCQLQLLHYCPAPATTCASVPYFCTCHCFCPIFTELVENLTLEGILHLVCDYVTCTCLAVGQASAI
jgi:hypothetical protein